LNETDLRELLDIDSSGGDVHRQGVTVADVDRRARSIRRRRVRAVGGLLAAGLAVTAAVYLPAAFHGPGGEPPDRDVWTGVMAQPPPADERPVKVFHAGRELHRTQGRRGGSLERFTFNASGRRIGVTLTCEGRSEYAFLWINGTLVYQGPCGLQAGATRYQPTWFDRSGNGRPGPDVGEYAIVPVTAVPDAGKGGSSMLSSVQAKQIVSAATPFRSDVEVTVNENAFIHCTTQQDIVIIDPASGRRILSSTCPDVGDLDVFPTDSGTPD
jgi:YD repeat-containing protein